MYARRSLVFVLTCLAWTINTTQASDVELNDGDLVVFIGNTLIEREQEYGSWELALTTSMGGKEIRFRNLGWSGDTVWAESRGIFDPPQVGYQRLIELVKELNPQLIVLGYGGVESEAGEARLTAFLEQYQRLVQDVTQCGAKCAHLSPVPLEVRTFPEQSTAAQQFVVTRNQQIGQYAAAIEEFSKNRQERFIDLRPLLKTASHEQNWYDNGLHLSVSGYEATAATVAAGLGFTADSQLNAETVEELRKLIRRKNELFFHRWRPQNITYLTGFRKHEQGQNAVEIAQFDPLVAKLETQIFQILD